MFNNSSIIRIIFLVTGIFLYSACSETPIYHGKRAKRGNYEPSYKKNQPIIQINTVFSPPVKNYHRNKITSGFGIRNDPKYKFKELHTGIDIDTKIGDPVIASAPGKIVFAGRKSGYGKVIIIDHGKRIHTVYAHLSSILCRKDDHVKRGETIGNAGKSGNATGSHLHFEIRKSGKAVNPTSYINI
jgi:murein DD-endopeptidase MepM/ murein hydrolase activator NlpD